MDQVADKTLETALRDFKRSVEITRDVRFQANLRLSRRHRASAYIVSFLSTYVIALSLLPNITTLNHAQNQILLACSVLLSVFVIFTSLIDGSQNFYHHGELLHQCARKVAAIHHELKLIDPTGGAESAREALQKLEHRYQAALDDCPVNHDNVDFYREIANKPHLFPDQLAGRYRWWVVGMNRCKVLVLGGSWMIPHIFAVLAISTVVIISVTRFLSITR